MSLRRTQPEYLQSGTAGPSPADFYGTDAVDGTIGHWAKLGPGSSYVRVDLTNNLARLPLYKLKNGPATFDWAGLQCLCERVNLSNFTDGGGTSGTYDLKTQIPVGAYVLQTLLQNVTGFTGDTSAVIIVGDGSDVDRYNTGTPSVFTTANMVAMGVPSGTKEHTAAATITVKVTSAADFTSVAAGAFTIKIFYLL